MWYRRVLVHIVLIALPRPVAGNEAYRETLGLRSSAVGKPLVDEIRGEKGSFIFKGITK